MIFSQDCYISCSCPFLTQTQTIWEARRSKANRYRVRNVQDSSAALERLEKRLAAAEEKRHAALHAVKIRAAVTANRAAAVARAEAARRERLQSRLTQSLEAAEVARAAHLADTAARAARSSSKASASARVAKQREQTQAASRLTTLLHRMKRAEASREQVLVARREGAAAVAAAAAAVAIPAGAIGARGQQGGGPISMSISPLNNGYMFGGISMPTESSSLHFEQQRPVIGANAGQWLRRQAAARRIQRCWRSFATKVGTTEDLVRKFAATKIPFSCQAVRSTAETDTAAAEAVLPSAAAPINSFQVTDDQEDSPTPPGSNSPRSTLSPGRIYTTTSDAGRTAPANTPADTLTPVDSSTPADTPADTPRAGSPPLYGPPTPPMPVPIPTSAAAVQRGEDAGAAAAMLAPANLAASSSVSSSFSASPSPRRQPVARLASSLAEMAAATSRHEDTPAPLPASFHQSTLSFDEFAEAMSAIGTLKAAQGVLRRFEDMGKIKETFARGNLCEGLLTRLFPKLPKGKKADRYPARAFLSAYMIQLHPEVVLSQQGPRETALAQAAGRMLASFETLLTRFHSNSIPSSSSSSSSSLVSLAGLLRQFDESWIAYLELFIAWKSHDAAGLESELIRAAVELESSRLLKVGSRAAAAAAVANATIGNSSSTMPSPRAAARAEAAKQDLEALVEGVDHDLKLISERVERLTGRQGAARLEAALAAARASAEQQQHQYNSMNSIESSSLSSSRTITTTASAGGSAILSPSPSNSPAKKVQRRQGQYANTSSSSPGSSIPSSPKQQASPTEENQEERADQAQQSQPQSQPQSQQNLNQSMDQYGNLVLMWQLLYDSTWHLPMEEAESSWKDAVGETDPMSEPAPTPQDLENLLLQGQTTGSGVSTEVLAAALHARVRRIAEKAFWDDLAQRLSGGGNNDAGDTSKNANNTATSSSAVSAAVNILAEAGAALRAVLPEGSSAAADVAAQLGSAERLSELLTATPNIASTSSSSTSSPLSSVLPGINCDALFQMLEWCGRLLRRLGAPAREAAAAAAQDSIRKDLAKVTTSAAAGKIVARALRFIAVLLKLLRLDMANAHLGMLARQLGTTPERAALYARSKMQDFLGTPSMTGEDASYLYSTSARDMALKLPHTRGWLALASGRLPQVEAMLFESSSSSSLNSSASASAEAGATSAAVPQELPRRVATGRATATSSTSTTSTSNAGLARQLAVPISPKTWQGLVRCGLAQLVAGEGAVTRLGLPETLKPDAARLQSGQNEFQRLVVLTASLLALQHASRVGGAGSASGFDGSTPSTAFTGSTATSTATVEAAKRRLSAILASPDVCLADVAAEITSLAQAPQQEASINAILRNMLGKSSPALRSITSALCNALNAHLVLGTSSPAAVNASNAALTRCGAGALGAEVAILAGKLAEVAAVTEAVCGPWYEILSSDLLTNVGH
jgi:T-complex protein 11